MLLTYVEKMSYFLGCAAWSYHCLQNVDNLFNTSKSLYARQVSEFLYKLSAKVHQHLFYYFHNSFLLIKDDFYNITL